MAYEKKDMSGTLFKNDRREKDSHPNATGTAIIDGVEYWVSAWTKDGVKGKFQSLSFKRKEERREQIKESYGSEKGRGERDSYGNSSTPAYDDEIPF